MFLGFYFTGLTSGLMASRWQIMAGLMPGMLVGDHANTSTFSERNFSNRAFSLQEALLRYGELVLDAEGLCETVQLPLLTYYPKFLTC